MQTEIVKVTGMTCGGCTSKVTNALKKVTGVGDVKVSAERQLDLPADDNYIAPF